MTTSETEPPIASHRECDCPDYIERCAHLGEHRLVLAGRPCSVHRYDFAVSLTPNTPPNSQYNCCGAKAWTTSWHPRWKPRYQGDSEADALEAFYAAERELLDADVDALFADVSRRSRTWQQLDAEAGR